MTSQKPPRYRFERDRCDWRWARARELAEAGRPPDRADDSWVRLACSYLQGGRRRRLAGATVADVATARRLAGLDGLRRWSVEAHLLSGRPVAAVARRVGSTPAVVGAYAALFFDVTGRLDATDWVMTEAIGQSPHRRFDNVEGFLKWNAFAGGPRVLDHLLRGLVAGEAAAGGLEGVRDELYKRLSMRPGGVREEILLLRQAKAYLNRRRGKGPDRSTLLLQIDFLIRLLAPRRAATRAVKKLKPASGSGSGSGSESKAKARVPKKPPVRRRTVPEKTEPPRVRRVATASSFSAPGGEAAGAGEELAGQGAGTAGRPGKGPRQPLRRPRAAAPEASRAPRPARAS